MHFAVVELLQLSVLLIWLGNPYPCICCFFQGMFLELFVSALQARTMCIPQNCPWKTETVLVEMHR